MKIVVNGKEITNIRALHLCVCDNEKNCYVIYDVIAKDLSGETHVLCFGEGDLESISI